jgi:hypothetical protein
MRTQNSSKKEKRHLRVLVCLLVLKLATIRALALSSWSSHYTLMRMFVTPPPPPKIAPGWAREVLFLFF